MRGDLGQASLHKQDTLPPTLYPFSVYMLSYAQGLASSHTRPISNRKGISTFSLTAFNYLCTQTVKDISNPLTENRDHHMGKYISTTSLLIR